MLKKLLLLAGLFGTLLASCSQDDSDRLAHEATTPEGPGVEVMLNFGAEQFRDTSLEQGQKTQSGLPLTTSSTMRRTGVLRRLPLTLTSPR